MVVVVVEEEEEVKWSEEIEVVDGEGEEGKMETNEKEEEGDEEEGGRGSLEVGKRVETGIKWIYFGE